MTTRATTHVSRLRWTLIAAMLLSCGSSITLVMLGCQQVPMTNRKQVLLSSEESENLARASPATEVRHCEPLSIRPRVGGSKTVQLQHKEVTKNTLHRPRVQWRGLKHFVV